MPKKPRKKVTDDSLMEWGEHKNKRMQDVPPDYLLWLFRQDWIRQWPDMHDYLVANQDAILSEAEDEEPEREGEFTSFDDYMNYGRN